MTVPVFIRTTAIDRIFNQIYGSGIIPEVGGRLGRSNFLHTCYNIRLIGAPVVVTTDAGEMFVRVPVNGKLSIPWGIGLEFRLDAEIDLHPEIVGDAIRIVVGDIIFNELSVGQGCSFPPELLKLLGPFVRGAIFPDGRGEGAGSFTVALPPIPLPLSSVVDGAPEIRLAIEDLMVFGQGLVVFVGLPGDRRSSIPSRPLDEGYDLTAAISEEDAERLVVLAMEGGAGEVEGDKTIAIPDQTRLIDMLRASGETITSLGRRGLGRRALKSSSRVKFRFTARTGNPKISFLEGDRITIHDIPAHLNATAEVEMDMPTSGILDRLRSLVGLGKRKGGRPGKEKETVSVTKWDVDEDFAIKKVELSVGSGSNGKPDWKVTDLDIDLTLPWFLPEKTIEEIVGTIGSMVVTARIPKEIPSEVPLPGDVPLKVIIERAVMSTVPGTLYVKAVIRLVPHGPVDQGREAIKAQLEERINAISEERLYGADHEIQGKDHEEGTAAGEQQPVPLSGEERLGAVDRIGHEMQPAKVTSQVNGREQR